MLFWNSLSWGTKHRKNSKKAKDNGGLLGKSLLGDHTLRMLENHQGGMLDKQAIVSTGGRWEEKHQLQWCSPRTGRWRYHSRRSAHTGTLGVSKRRKGREECKERQDAKMRRIVQLFTKSVIWAGFPWHWGPEMCKMKRKNDHERRKGARQINWKGYLQIKTQFNKLMDALQMIPYYINIVWYSSFSRYNYKIIRCSTIFLCQVNM